MLKKSKPLLQSREARLLLRLSMAIITVVSVTVLISYLHQAQTLPATAAYRHRAMLEYLIAGVTISVGGTLLVEVTTLEDTKK